MLSFVVTFITVSLRGWQHKNVIGHHMKSIAVTSYLIHVFDLVVVALIVRNNLYIAFVSGFAASLAMVTSVMLHDRVYKSESIDE